MSDIPDPKADDVAQRKAQAAKCVEEMVEVVSELGVLMVLSGLKSVGFRLYIGFSVALQEKELNTPLNQATRHNKKKSSKSSQKYAEHITPTNGK